MYGNPKRHRRSIFQMVEARERCPSAQLDMQILRWAAGEWLDKPIRSSSYCKLNPEAKSTIALAFSTDGVLFASTHGDHTVKVFRCATWSLLTTLRGHRRTPWTIKFHPIDRNILASGSLDETVRIWDLISERCMRTLEFDFVVSCIAFHSSGELLAVTSGRRIFLCRWQQRSAPQQALPVAGPQGPAPSPSRQPLLPNIIERIAGWGASSPAAASSGGGASPAGAAAAAASAMASSDAMDASAPNALPEPPSKVVILAGENPQRCVAFKVRARLGGPSLRPPPPPPPPKRTEVVPSEVLQQLCERARARAHKI
jgi:hypothetical protein